MQLDRITEVRRIDIALIYKVEIKIMIIDIANQMIERGNIKKQNRLRTSHCMLYERHEA